MPIMCKVCILENGLKHIGRKRFIFEEETDFLVHLEKCHDIAVTRQGETDKESDERLKKLSETAGTKNCLCPTCVYGDLWGIILQAFNFNNTGFWIEKPLGKKMIEP